MTYTITREFEVTIDKLTVSWGEVRITYTISKGVPSRNWTNASDGNYYPAEGPSVDVTKVEMRFGEHGRWHDATDSDDLLSWGLTDAWLIEQAMEDAE